MTWTIEKTIPTLAVPSLVVGIEYYGRLGFAVDWRWPDIGSTHAGLSRGECSIMLSQAEPSERADVYFIVDDVDACYQEIIESGAWELAPGAGAAAEREDCPPEDALSPPAPPEVTEYGLRDFSVVDPWGHHIVFGEPIDAEDD